jgi:hypothetical protein
MIDYVDMDLIQLLMCIAELRLLFVVFMYLNITSQIYYLADTTCTNRQSPTSLGSLPPRAIGAFDASKRLESHGDEPFCLI